MKRMNFVHLTPLVRENLNVALKSVKSNRLRSVLTILMIAIGITALLGILTSTEVLRHNIRLDFEQMGANSFYIRANYYRSATGKRERIRNDKNISYRQALLFKEKFQNTLPSKVTLYALLSTTSVKRGEKSTSPNISLFLSDENYNSFNNYEIAHGRDISSLDISKSAMVCVITQDVRNILFSKNEDPIGQNITVAGGAFEIIGISKETISSSGGNLLEVVIPVTCGRAHLAQAEKQSYIVGIKPSIEVKDATLYYEKAEQLFRSIRRLAPSDKSDFYMSYNEKMANSSQKTLGNVTLIAAIIGIITLLGAAVGLMNIMLVAVKERTAEIGVRKALGASAKLIRQQFLFEAVVIAQIGCILGVSIGIPIGNSVSYLMSSPFFIPWGWMGAAVLLCMVVGICSGYLPAKRAAEMDPIVALRYE